MPTPEPRLCRPHVRPLGQSVCADALIEALSRMDNPAILGGNRSVQGQSIFTAKPLEIFECRLDQPDPLGQLAAALSQYQMPPSENKLFTAGWIGFFAYELGRFIETLPGRAPCDLSFPLIRLAFYDRAVVYDHAADRWFLAALEIDGDLQTADEKLQALHDWIDLAQTVSVPEPAAGRFKYARCRRFHGTFSQAQYLRAIAKIKHHIIDGDTYQINLSRRLSVPFAGRPVDLFRWQNRFNPSPYAAFLQWGDMAVVSASPELFLEVAGRHDPYQTHQGHPPAKPDPAGHRPRKRRQLQRPGRKRKRPGRAGDDRRPGTQRPGPRLRAGNASRHLPRV
jgi:para-aminobenzoate synthetase component I